MSDPLTVEVKGVKWHKYLFEWTGPDGTFGSHFYAISLNHALLVLEDIKQTATLKGRAEGEIKA